MEKPNVNRSLAAALLVVIAVLAYGLIGKAGNLQPPAAPAPTMKTLDEVEPRIPISHADIPLTISTPGSYYLTENVTTVGTAITVAADDVTIDLAGFALVGPDSGTNYGIYMDERSNVEIRSGTVRNFHTGIYEYSTSGRNHRVIDVRAVFNSDSGIYLAGSGHLVKDCLATNNGVYAATLSVYGIYASSGSGGSGSTVTGCTASDNGVGSGVFNVYGIYTSLSSTVTGNTSCNNGDLISGSVVGIHAGYGSTVSGNTAYNNGISATGIYDIIGISTQGICTVTGNTACDNGLGAGGDVYGIKLGGNSLVHQNTAYNNGQGAASATQITYGVAGCVYGINVPPPAP